MASNLLPPTTNAWLSSPSGPALLYNPTLDLISFGLFQHGLVFGIAFLLRNFSAKGVANLHYLTFLLSLTLILAPLVFLLDQYIDAIKLFFFLEHEAIEYLIAALIWLPCSLIAERSGLVILCLWLGLSAATIVVSLNDFHHHGADLVAWMAFVSDLLLAISGLRLIHAWWIGRISKGNDLRSKVAVLQELRIKAMSGGAFFLHGFSTIPIAPILVAILYGNANPAWFAYAWAIVFGVALVAIALTVPAIMTFFGTIHWCCWHVSTVIPGDMDWDPEDASFVPSASSTEAGGKET
ncbi:hypothetical protein N431DRAFT_445743 [Stipitochalara longipes BDJ]|nr:hypothetical protein N431DRAFT_445743 [Stipitochalara longipes BDJ]